MPVERHLMLLRDPRHGVLQQLVRRLLVGGGLRPEIDVQDGVIRHEIIGAAALDPRWIAGKAAAARRLQPQREVRRRTEERRVGKEGVSTWNYRWAPYH